LLFGDRRGLPGPDQDALGAGVQDTACAGRQGRLQDVNGAEEVDLAKQAALLCPQVGIGGEVVDQATSADRDQVKVWDVSTGQELLTLRGAPSRSVDGGFYPPLTWSPDGRRLAVANWLGDVSVWDATDRPAAAPAGLPRVAEGRLYLWHLEEASAAATADQRAAAVFHLGRVRGGEPPDILLRLRRARLLERSGALDQAAADYAQVFAV
jgi:hypothetical protein